MTMLGKRSASLPRPVGVQPSAATARDQDRRDPLKVFRMADVDLKMVEYSDDQGIVRTELVTFIGGKPHRVATLADLSDARAFHAALEEAMKDRIKKQKLRGVVQPDVDVVEPAL